MGGNEKDQHCKIKRNAKHRELSEPYNCLNHVPFKFSVVPVILLRKIPVFLINNFTLQYNISGKEVSCRHGHTVNRNIIFESFKSCCN